MAIAILGNTETTSASKSSGYAQSKEHAEQQDEIIAADLVMIENYLNSDKFINILKSYGYAVDGGYFAYELDLNLNKLKLRLEIDMQVSEKVPVADDYWYETYGIPKPANYNQLKKEKGDEKHEGIRGKEEIKEPLTDNTKLSTNNNLQDLAEQGALDKIFQKVADFFAHALQS